MRRTYLKIKRRFCLTIVSLFSFNNLRYTHLEIFKLNLKFVIERLKRNMIYRSHMIII